MERAVRAMLALLLFAGTAAAAPLNVTISGDSAERAPLETLSPDPAIPTMEALSFSLDGGISAAADEIVPLSVSDAARMADPAVIPVVTPPIIPGAPYILQPLPTRESVAAFHRPLINSEISATSELEWEFSVADETNRVVHRRSGKGWPEEVLMWDGTEDGEFILDPNRTYSSFWVARASSSALTWPGDANRFQCFERRTDDTTEIHFGARFYDKSGIGFDPMFQPYLDDLVYRLYWNTNKGELHIYESDEAVAQRRAALWVKLLNEKLGTALAESYVKIHTVEGQESRALLVYPREDTPETHLRGNTAFTPHHLEKNENWLRIKREKHAIVVEFRHDRLFQPGTAYLKNEALPLIAKALKTIHDEKNINGTETEPMRAKRPIKDIVLRSFTEKARDTKKDKLEEDPALAALRTKTLFALFARARYAP